MEAVEYDDEFGAFDNWEPMERLQRCPECGREWYGPENSDQCPECHEAGGGPLPCFQCGHPCRWVEKGAFYRGPVAECSSCDQQYPLETVRTHRLGKLVERLVAESRTGSAEEVGRMILAAGRSSLRRVQ